MSEKEAFCPLLWVFQGGLVNAQGRRVASPGSNASGYCDEPTECFSCPLIQQEIAKHPPGTANWVCPDCLRTISKQAKQREIRIHMTGHYGEGVCQFNGCLRPPRREFRDINPMIPDDDVTPWTEDDIIERPAGYSMLLQLVIGDINNWE